MGQAFTPRKYLSWSQFHLFEESPEKYKEVYLLGHFETNKYLELGKKMASMLEYDIIQDDEVWEFVRQNLPAYPQREYEIRDTIDDIPLLGKLDGFDPESCLIGEYKSGKEWTQKKVDENEQLTFYSLLVWNRFHKLPQIQLHWVRTEENENKDLFLTKDIKTFETQRTIKDFILLMPRIKRAWQGIQNLTRNEINNVL